MTDSLSANDRMRTRRVLDAWFPENSYEAPQIDARMDLWFGEDQAFDERLREQFSEEVADASSYVLEHWAADADGRLATILLIDQFRRNIYRGTPRAFSHDRVALKLTVEGIVQKLDRELSPVQRVFFYMPLQHAESIRVQQKSVQVFDALALAVSDTLKETFETFAQFAELHHDIIAQFGRFPHRNAILGRTNTDKEERYLNDESADFGQTVES